MRYTPVAILFFASQAGAVTIDQIAITVGHTVITESQIDADIRVTAFLNQQPAVASPEQRRAAAARLIDRALISTEMAETNYPLPDDATVDAALERVKSAYGGADSWQRALKDAQIEESDVRRHLALQIATLRFIAFRFRPDSTISESDIADDYARQSATRKAEHPGEAVPNLQSSRNRIRRELVEQRTDEALNSWLVQARKQSHIVYLDQSLVAPVTSHE